MIKITYRRSVRKLRAMMRSNAQVFRSEGWVYQPTGRRSDYDGFSFLYTPQLQKTSFTRPPFTLDQFQVNFAYSPVQFKFKVIDVSGQVPPRSFNSMGDSVSVIPPNQFYAGTREGNGDGIVVYFDNEFMHRVADEVVRAGDVQVTSRHFIRDPFLEQLGISLRPELAKGSPSLLYAESLATVMAVHLIRNYSLNSPQPYNLNGTLSPCGLRKAIDYIDMHLAEDLSLCNIAAELKISPYHFAKMFKNTTGIPPHRFVTRKRVERAKQLLSERYLKIVDVALAVGFANQCRFTEAFVRCVGKTPHAYRSDLTLKIRVS